MKLAHKIVVKVFSYEKFDEDDKIISKKLLGLFPFSLEEEKIKLNKTNALGLDKRKITIFEITLTKEKHTVNFLNNLTENLDEEQKELILSQLGQRLDDNLDFFLRFDKSEYLKNNKLKLTDSGKCFHIRISVAAFPKTRALAMDIIKEIFTGKT